MYKVLKGPALPVKNIGCGIANDCRSLFTGGVKMENAFIFIMIFGAMLILYGLLMNKTGDINLLPYRRRYAAKMNDKKAYVKQIGKFIMIIGLSPLSAGAVEMIFGNEIAAGIVFAVTIVAAIIVCVKTYKVL